MPSCCDLERYEFQDRNQLQERCSYQKLTVVKDGMDINMPSERGNDLQTKIKHR